MCTLCIEGAKKLGPIDRQAAIRIASAADPSFGRPSVDDWPGYSPHGQPADIYQLALGRTAKPTVVKDAAGLVDSYATALQRRKEVFRV